MIITITTIAAIAAAVFGAIQTKKLKEATEAVAEKDSLNRVLRAHMTNVESELKASNDYIRSLRSELQSCTDKAKAAKAKTQNTKPAAKAEKAPAAMKAAAPKAKRPYKKKAD